MARSFDTALDQYLEIDSTPVTAVPFTFACWAFAASDMGNVMMFIGDKDVAADWWVLARNSANDRAGFRCRDTASADANSTNGSFPVDTWLHICGVATASNDRDIYVNAGNSGNDNTDLTPDGADRVSIGRFGDSSPGSEWDGYIAEAAIWNVALTVSEVGILAKGFSPLFVRPQSLVAYWPLIRDENQDRVGGYDLTAFNAPTIVAHPPVIYPAPVFVTGKLPITVARTPRHPAQYNTLAIY